MMSADTLRELTDCVGNNFNIFIESVQHHFSLSISYELLRQVRNDKYSWLLSPLATQVKVVDLDVIYQCDSYLTLQEKCYLSFLKQQLNADEVSQGRSSIPYMLPPSLYKLPPQKGLHGSSCVLQEQYKLPDSERIGDWVIILESTLNNVMALNCEQNFLMEVYLLQILTAFFIEGDDISCATILEKINTYINGMPVCSPELTIVIQTWCGILSETKNLVECEQSYMMALLTLHKIYGDPRARGGKGTPWEMFITARLSVLSRLQGKRHDAEYVEELFDATAMSLSENVLNRFYDTHHIYSEPFRDFLTRDKLTKSRTIHTLTAEGETSTLSKDVMDYLTHTHTSEKKIADLPLTHWTQHLAYDENSMKVEVISQTLPRSFEMLKWMVEYLPLNLSTGILWETSFLTNFFMSVMQNTFNSSTSVSSLSNFSMDRQQSFNNRDTLGGQSTPKGSATLKHEKKQKKFNQGGNLVQTIEKDGSTLVKQEAAGTIYTWGQNSQGQVGVPTNFIEEEDSMNSRKMRVFYPKVLLSLKDTVIISVACGHTHCTAITISRRLLAWGNNKAGQLGLGKKAPKHIYVPAVVPGVSSVSMVSCGTEHTIAQTLEGKLYSWGQGDGGLLGHGNTESQYTPKLIDGLSSLTIMSVVCGGLHTLAVSKQGQVYSWGRGEGGQLGVPPDQQTHDAEKNELYLTVPKRVRGILDGLFVAQVACGDAHSLALTQMGHVYAWGYSHSGQLGLGVSQDNFDPEHSKYGLNVQEPALVETLTRHKIAEIFAGSTFSLFMNEKKEVWYDCC